MLLEIIVCVGELRRAIKGVRRICYDILASRPTSLSVNTHKCISYIHGAPWALHSFSAEA